MNAWYRNQDDTWMLWDGWKVWWHMSYLINYQPVGYYNDIRSTNWEVALVELNVNM